MTTAASPHLTLFSPEQLQRLVMDTLPADARPGEHIIVGTVDQHGVQVVASFAPTSAPWGGVRWELQAAARHDWTGENQVAGKVLLRW